MQELYIQYKDFLKEDRIYKSSFVQSIYATEGGSSSSSKMQNKKIGSPDYRISKKKKKTLELYITNECHTVSKFLPHSILLIK